MDHEIEMFGERSFFNLLYKNYHHIDKIFFVNEISQDFRVIHTMCVKEATIAFCEYSRQGRGKLLLPKLKPYFLIPFSLAFKASQINRRVQDDIIIGLYGTFVEYRVGFRFIYCFLFSP